MACIRSDGTLSPAAQAILSLIENETTVEVIAKRLKRPIYAVRASLRELSSAGLVSATEGAYELTPIGRARAGDVDHKELAR